MRRLGVACFGLITLQWFLLGGPNGIRVHQVGIGVLTVAVFLAYGFSHIAPVVRRFQVFVLASTYMYVTWLAITVALNEPIVPPLQQLIYMGIFLAIAIYFYVAIEESGPSFVETLRWTAPLALLIFLLAMGYSSVQNRVNVIEVAKQALSTLDPNVIEFQFFRRIFSGSGLQDDTVRSNFRHEIFGGLLFAMYVSGWAVSRIPFTRTGHVLIYRVTMTLATFSLLISLSRSIIIAAAVWPVLLMVRALLTGKVSQRSQLAGIAVLGAIMVGAVSGLGTILYQRFFVTTSSYDARAGNLGTAFDSIVAHFWFGVNDITGKESAHNFVLDAWASAGVFVGLPALVIFAFVVVLWLSLLVQVRTLPDHLMPVVAAMALPLIRMVTQGGGLLAMVEWVTLGFVAGVLAAYQHRLQREGAAAAVHRKPARKPVSQSVSQSVR